MPLMREYIYLNAGLITMLTLGFFHYLPLFQP